MRLTVCFLTRNEEANIARALRSAAPIADQLLVVDTASTDQTAGIAAQLGADVRQFDWHEDFSAGRNFATQQAKGDWLLWMNADEELLPPSAGTLDAALAREDVFGYFVSLHNIVSADRPDVFTETAD